MIEFPQRRDTPHPLGLRGVEHRPGNHFHLALVNPPTPLAEPRTTPWHRTTASVFDQQGSNCTAEGSIGMLITLPFRYQFQPYRSGYDTEQKRFDFYLDIQRHDAWPGGEPDYEGSSSDAAFITLRERGVIAGWSWLMGEDALWEWVSLYGPAGVGTTWKEGMFEADSRGYIHVDGADMGGHFYEIAFASHARQAYRIINSWSTAWGQNGRAWVTRGGMRTLLAEDGEAVTIKTS